MVISALVSRLAAGSPLAASPTVIDLERSSPPNPPEHVQVQFVGQSFDKA